tara:strand:+ start:10590 stop:11441 length:852 start_codon:yes stop_codon:yes gene_type:complete
MEIGGINHQTVNGINWTDIDRNNKFWRGNMDDYNELGDNIAEWISNYAKEHEVNTLVIGVSGGVDSAVTSTLCAKTGIRTIVLNMPIRQKNKQINLSNQHIEWLKSNWKNVESKFVDLTGVYENYSTELSSHNFSELALANTKARLRMVTLYAFAASNNGIVVGTGNKVEDFGVGFYTKYGDGGVDISPIADLLKSEVFSLGKSLGIIDGILSADPTDGLWDDSRTDEEQIGASYQELEWAMKELENPNEENYNDRQKEILELYSNFNSKNSHKMNPIPIFKK